MSQPKPDLKPHEELQERVCRACNTTYRYPVPHSLASRFYCQECMELPPGLRAAFEQMNKRLKTLTARVEKLERAALDTRGASGGLASDVRGLRGGTDRPEATGAGT